MNANSTNVPGSSRARLVIVDWMRRFNKRATNRLAMRFAGKHVYAVVHHQGRKTGRPYQTPVVAMPAGDCFIFPLPYGEHADWRLNVQAAGECTMELGGRRYALRAPTLIEPSAALPAFPAWMHGLLRRTEVYLKMERAAAPELPSGQKMRKILVYGAGVLGSLYAGKLQQAGYDVSILARGQRLAQLKEHGLVLVDAASGATLRPPVTVVDCLAPDDAYDLVMVVVRKNQLPSVLPALAASRCTPNVLFMVNNAEGPCRMVDALGAERVLLGFPGAGGERAGHVVRYHVTSGIQPTTIGELDGIVSERLMHVAQALRDADFPVAISENMDAWLKTHVALVSPIANALYLAGGSNYRLARTRDGVVLCVRAVREGLRVLQALNIPVTPARYRLLAWLPEPLLVAVLRQTFNTPRAELVMARHANAARDEMLTLAEEFQTLARCSGVPTPAIDALYPFVDPQAPTLPEGQASLRMDWRSTVAAGLLALGGLVLAARLLRRKRSERI